jgi:hypothetical protein
VSSRGDAMRALNARGRAMRACVVAATLFVLVAS